MIEVGGYIFFCRSNSGSVCRKLGYSEAHSLKGDVVSGKEALEEDITETEDGKGLASRGVAVSRMRV